MLDFAYVDIDETPIADKTNPEKQLLLKERFAQLSNEARQLLQIIFESPSEIIKLQKNKSKDISIRAIHAYTEKNMGMTIRKGREIVNELRGVAYGDD